MSSIISSPSRNDSIYIDDCSPITPSCIRALIEGNDDKRKVAAREIQRMSYDFGLSNNLSMVNRLISVLGMKLCSLTTPNARKGGLLGLTAVMVGFNNGQPKCQLSGDIMEEVVRHILTCFNDSDRGVRCSACDSLYNIIKVAGPNILPLFKDIFDNMSRIVADNDLQVRSSAEILDKLLKDIVVEQETLEYQSFIPNFEEYIYTKNPFTRMFIISWIRLLDSKIDMLHYLPQLLDGIFTCLYDSTEPIKASTLNLLSEFLNKIVVSSTDELDVSSLTSTLLKHAQNADDPTVARAVLEWLERLKRTKTDFKISGALERKLSKALLEILCSKSDLVVKNALRVLTDLFCYEENIDKKATLKDGDTNDNTNKKDINKEGDENVLRFIQSLYRMLRDKVEFFEERGTFIIVNLCSMVRADIIYKSFAVILKDEKTDLKFAYSLVQKLNEILLTNQALFPLRSRLGSANTNSNTDPEEAQITSLFLSLYYAWCHSPIAALTLCLLTNNYKHANEIVLALSQTDITVDILSQIAWVVQLIESPVFAALRMKLLDVNSNQYLLQSLYGLLMILPQSEAFSKLAHRLDQVYKFMSAQPHFPPTTTSVQSPSTSSHPTTKPSLSTSTSSSSGSGSRDVNRKVAASQADKTTIETLMKHYFRIQEQRIKCEMGFSMVNIDEHSI